MNKVYLHVGSLCLICLFPFTFHLTFKLISNIPFHPQALVSLSAGLVISFFLCKTTQLLQPFYIFFHEMSHALLTLITSGKIHEIQITKDIGYVKASTNNLWVRLAPYLFPLASIVVFIIFFFFITLDQSYPLQIRDRALVFSSFTLMFSFTWMTTTYYNFFLLKKESSDVKKEELVFSLALIANSYLVSSAFLLKGILHPKGWMDFLLIP